MATRVIHVWFVGELNKIQTVSKGVENGKQSLPKNLERCKEPVRPRRVKVEGDAMAMAVGNPR